MRNGLIADPWIHHAALHLPSSRFNPGAYDATAFISKVTYSKTIGEREEQMNILKRETSVERLLGHMNQASNDYQRLRSFIVAAVPPLTTEHLAWRTVVRATSGALFGFKVTAAIVVALSAF